jgi:hypothetical protein
MLQVETEEEEEEEERIFIIQFITLMDFKILI